MAMSYLERNLDSIGVCVFVVTQQMYTYDLHISLFVNFALKEKIINKY